MLTSSDFFQISIFIQGNAKHIVTSQNRKGSRTLRYDTLGATDSSLIIQKDLPPEIVSNRRSWILVTLASQAFFVTFSFAIQINCEWLYVEEDDEVREDYQADRAARFYIVMWMKDRTDYQFSTSAGM